MLTRLIAYIKEVKIIEKKIDIYFIIYLLKNGDNFTKLISDIRLTMQLNMKDDQTGHNPTVGLFQSVYLIHI
jgi:hypothetical protein